MFIIKEFLIFMIQQVCGPNSQSDLKTEYYSEYANKMQYQTILLCGDYLRGDIQGLP